MLLAKGGALEARDVGERTPLHFASVRGHEEVVQLLLEAGASHTAQSKLGVTPLQMAAERERPRLSNAHVLGLAAQLASPPAFGRWPRGGDPCARRRWGGGGRAGGCGAPHGSARRGCDGPRRCHRGPRRCGRGARGNRQDAEDTAAPRSRAWQGSGSQGSGCCGRGAHCSRRGRARPSDDGHPCRARAGTQGTSGCARRCAVASSLRAHRGRCGVAEAAPHHVWWCWERDRNAAKDEAREQSNEEAFDRRVPHAEY